MSDTEETPVRKNPDDALEPWQRQQKKTFTNWVNLHLRKFGFKAEEIRTAFESGIQLMKLIEAISGESCGKPDKVRFRIHKIQNINKALQRIKDCQVRLVGISSEEICDGNLKMILGMIWTLILRFQIQGISMERMSAKDGLLLWCQKKTHDYGNVTVKNFHLSFKDGLAFCALIHKHRPDLIDYKSLTKADPLTNLQTAFDVMEKEYDIPQLLDAQDIVEMPKPDEMSVMAYVSLYYHAFQSGKENELAARRISKLLAAQREIDRLKREYESMITDLLEWIAAQRVFRQQLVACSSVNEVQARLADVNTYRKTEKSQRGKDKNALEDHYRALQNKLRLANRAPYNPVEGIHVKDVQAAWKALQVDESHYDQHLRDELVRLEQLEDLYRTFMLKADSIKRWTAGKEQTASSEDYGENYAAVVSRKQQHNAFVSQLDAYSQRTATLNDLYTQLESLGYHNVAAVAEAIAAVEDTFATLKQLSAVRSEKLNEQEAFMKWRDDMQLEYAKAADDLSGNLEALFEDLSMSVRVRSLAEAEALPESQQAFAAKAAELVDDFNAVQELQNALDAEGITYNTYASYSVADLQGQIGEVDAQIAAREQAIATETERQQSAETLRKSFAEVAEPMAAFVDDQREGIVADSMAGSLEEQRTALEARVASFDAKQADFELVAEASAALEDALVFTNEHTDVTMETLANDWDAIKNQGRKALSENANAIEQRDALGITDEEVADLKKTYDHFDKDKTGSLDRLEFRACLMASDVQLPTLVNSDDPDPKFDAIVAECAQQDTQVVLLPDFIAYMGKQNKREDTPEQLLASLRVMAGDKDVITVAQLSAEFSPEDVEDLTSKMTPTDNEGEYDYASFVQTIFGSEE